MSKKGPAPVTRWRYGDRDPVARRERLEALRTWRHSIRLAALTPTTRAKVLGAIAAGVPITQAAHDAGLTIGELRGPTRYDPEWADQLDSACRAGAPADTPHGTSVGYRTFGCRCRECRAVHHPASTREPHP